MLKHPESMNFKTRLNIHYLLMVAGAVITMLGCYLSRDFHLHPLAWLGIVLMALGLVWRILYIKCPHCGDGLYGTRTQLKHCPNCGRKLD